MEKAIGVIDEPVAPGATDNLDISIHSRSLIKFIQGTNTPITVGIQGEWGSGKTSLINSIHHAFDGDETVKQIWINSWEYSLLSTPEEALLKIVNRIIDELLESDTDVNRAEAIKEGAGKIFRGALRVGAQVALGSEAAKVANELLESSGQSISALRQQLTDLVNDIANRSSNPYKKIVIYVDDLDRIEPKNAVAILELLKNIFSVPNCVFILAIDYQVVVKGLEHKFGKQTPENEWEFRAFFDKIIQLPFMMPMGQYNIGKYVNSLLLDIGFVGGEGLDDEAVREIILRTIGGNPRSIKRLVNSVSLIQIFSEVKAADTGSDERQEKDTESEEEGISSEDEKFLLFALLCLQIAYPPVYSLLAREPNFPIWDDALAFKETKRSEEDEKEVFEREFDVAKQTEDFNEEWEQALYRVCYTRPRLKPRVADMSKFFSYIKDELLAAQQDEIGTLVAEVLSKTSVTSVTSTDQGQTVLPEREGAYKRRYLDGIEAFILDGRENRKASDEAVEFMGVLYEDLKEHFSEAEFKFAGSMSLYLAKHKFFLAGFESNKAVKNGTCFQLIRHYENDYRMPNISGLLAPVPGRKFGPGKFSTAHNSDRYYIRVADLSSYRENKEALFALFDKSADMAANGWDKRLKIAYWKGHLSSVNETVDESHDTEKKYPKITELCLKYLDPDYTYDV
jgi:hypothetical protein